MNTPHDIIGYKQPIFGNPDKGQVVPIAKIENGLITEIDLEDYPNTGTIFISRNYEEIDDKFNNDELFLIRANLSFDFEENQDLPHKSKFWSDNTNLKPLDTNILIPILISSNLPDKETGIWRDINPNDVPNKPFFILMGNHIYGPFLPQSKNDNNVEVTPYNTAILGIPQNTISKIEWSYLENNKIILISNINTKKKIFLKSLALISDITNKKENQVDYISNANLINFFTKNGFGKNLGNLSKGEASKLKGLIESFSKDKAFNNNIQNNDRFIRIKSILDEFIEHNNENYNIINNFLKSKDGQNYLEKYFEKNQEEMTLLLEDKIKKQHDAIYQQYTSNLNDRKSRLDKQFEIEKESYGKQIDNLKNELESLKNESKNAAEAKIDENIQQKKLDLEKLNEDFNNLLKDKLYAETLDEAQLRLKILDKDTRKEVQKLEEKIAIYNDTLETKKKLFDNKSDLSQVISQTKLIQNIFEESEKKEIIIEDESTIFIPKPIENIYYNSLESLDNRPEYIKLIQNNINSFKEKTLSFDETANLIITLLQNYITVFSGPPGVGKTSTANNLGKALGLIDSESRSKNFLNVAVGRGWTTTQDFLGYYNSLRDCFQPSKTGLYQFLKENKNHENFLKIVLLDEANLSSMEHYWSDFLSICDDFEQNKFIDLGIPDINSRFLGLPPSLRFIATINNDSTVEPLSDRLLDRAAIITLNNDQINNDFNSSNLLNGAVPYDILKDSFTISNIENDIDNLDFSFNIVRNIISELKSDNVKGGQVNISNRKINTIKNYLKVANDIGFENHLSPADYAISQHILPKIKGHGSNLKTRLENVLKILKDNDLKNSQKILTNILNNGNSFTDSFDFFN